MTTPAQQCEQAREQAAAAAEQARAAAANLARFTTGADQLARMVQQHTEQR